MSAQIEGENTVAKTVSAPEAEAKVETRESFEITFGFERETKNTRRYAEVVADGDEAAIGTLYIQKVASALIGDPETLTVTIAVA